MPKLRKTISLVLPLALLLIALIVCIKNYSSGTYLIGWDSLHPEFSFSTYFSRMFFGAWREEQGLGAIAAHAHMADFPRVLILWLSSFVLPLNFLRYFYVFLCLIIGPLGVYFLIYELFKKEHENYWIEFSAFLAGLFYLLNLGTVQNFYVPFEMFPTAFATLPWLFLTSFKYLKSGEWKNLIFFALVVIFASPMAYASVLFYVSIVGLFLFLFFICVFSANKRLHLKRFITLLLTIILLNLYWILPNLYSLFKQSDTISGSQINRLFSTESFLKNVEYGDYKDILIQKNFLFDWRNFDFKSGSFKDLLNVWSNYLARPYVLLTGYMLAGVYIVGVFIGVIKREKVVLALLPVALFTLFFLFNINPPFGNLYAYFYNNFGVFREALRMPFTKFSILFELVASIYFGYFLTVLLSLKSKLLTPLKVLVIAAGSIGIIYWAWPAFNGEMIGKNVRQNLPNEYIDLFKWFDVHSEGRVALFPMNSKYGWEYREWGYEGSGFITYGIKNPILYRDFDRWSKFNEQFYNEASDALYAEDYETLRNTLKKYQVKYVLLDESVMDTGRNDKLLALPGSKLFFSGSGFKEVAKFGFLTVYDTGLNLGDEGIYAPKSQFAYSRPVLVKGNLLEDVDLSINHGFANAYNCDLMKIGSVYKNNSDNGILLRALGGGVSCDYLSFADLKYDRPYILHIAGENRSGRSLKIYFTNYKTLRADLEELLPPGKFDKEFPIYPSGREGEGYSLNFETRSYGRIGAENLVSKVEIYSASIKEGSNYFFEYKTPNNVEVKNVKKYGNWLYKVDLQGSGAIQLSQGYEDGWVAFSLTGAVARTLPHVLLNGWSNGWSVTENGVQTVYVFYWPQILEWEGLILGLGTFLYFAIRLKRP